MTIEMNLQKGLVGHWTMNSVDTEAGVVRDSTAQSNDAVINGATSDHLGRIATGFSFSGNGEDLVGPDIPATRSNPFTATAWVLIPDEFPSNVENNMSPLCVRTATNTKWSVHHRNPNSADPRQFQIFTENNGSIRTGDTFSEQKWHFIAVIDDGTDLKLRVNNTVYTDSGGGGTTFSSGGSEPLRIGATRQVGEFWQGNIDDVRYYNRVLSNRELDTLYNIRSDRSYGSPYVPQKPVAASNLVAWYPFEGQASDATAFQPWAQDDTDYSGSVNGATNLDSGGVNDIRLGSGSGAYDFDGNEYIDIDTSFTLPEEYTFSVWFNYRSLDDGDFYLLQNLGVDDNDPLFYYNDDTELRLFSSGQELVSASVSLNQETWHHVVFTDDGSETRIYHNGTDIGGGGAQNLQYIGDWYISTGNGLDAPTDGLIDDVRIYNRALTESEVSSIYNNTKP